MAFLLPALAMAAAPLIASAIRQSPTDQATAAANAQGQQSQAEIAQQEAYVTKQQQQERDAIAGLGPNPYYAAAGAQNPNAFAVNPANTTNFSTSGTTGKTTVTPGTPQAYTPAAPNLPANAFGGASFNGTPATASTPTSPSTPVAPGTGPISMQPIPGNPGGFGYGITGASAPIGSPTNAFQLTPNVPYPGSQASGNGGP